MPKKLQEKMMSMTNICYTDSLHGHNVIYYYAGTNIYDVEGHGVSEEEFEEFLKEISPYYLNWWMCWS
jgi:hypothetical protein